jgi:hypothetical protein
MLGFPYTEVSSMATAKRPESVQKVTQHLLGVLQEGLNLAYRLRDSEGFRAYVQRRIGLVAPIAVLIVLTSLACTAATVLYLGGMRPLLVLLAILLVPFVLAGSLFVQAYVFFFWLENRALAQALHRKAQRGPVGAWLMRKLRVDMGSPPPVPWILTAIFLVLPLAMLVMVAPKIGLVLVLLLVLAPILFARFDRP